MSLINESRLPKGVGILSLQHHGFPADGYTIDNRASIVACRILGRQTHRGFAQGQDKGLGHWVYDNASVGDVILTYLWLNNKKRPIPAWSFLFGTRIVPPDKFIPEAKAHCICPEAPDFLILPIGSGDYKVDARFIKYIFGKHPDWQKFPINYTGISLTTTEENRQTQLFMPTDPRLISTPYSDPLFNTHIVDVNDEMEIEPSNEGATLNTLTWIVKPRIGCTFTQFKNSLGWMIGRSGCENLLAGLVIDIRDCVKLPILDFPIISPPKRCEVSESLSLMDCVEIVFIPKTPAMYGLVNELDGGFIELGEDEDDKHRIGGTNEDRSINSAHISTKAFYFRDKNQDAPLDFDTCEYVPACVYPYIARTFLRYDKKSEHFTYCGKREGLWRWETEIPVGYFNYTIPKVPGESPVDREITVLGSLTPNITTELLLGRNVDTSRSSKLDTPNTVQDGNGNRIDIYTAVHIDKDGKIIIGATNGTKRTELATIDNTGNVTTTGGITSGGDVTAPNIVPNNLLLNPSFEMWNGIISSTVGDMTTLPRWTLGSGEMYREIVNTKNSSRSVGLNNASITQNVANNYNIFLLRGKKLTLSGWAKRDVLGGLGGHIDFTDGVNTSQYVIPNDTDWHNFTISLTIGLTASSITVNPVGSIGNIIYYDSLTLVAGSTTSQNSLSDSPTSQGVANIIASDNTSGLDSDKPAVANAQSGFNYFAMDTGIHYSYY